MLPLLIFILFFSHFVKAVDEEICFPLNQKKIEIKLNVTPKKIKLDPKGQKLLFPIYSLPPAPPNSIREEVENWDGRRYPELPPIVLPVDNRYRQSREIIPDSLYLFDLESSKGKPLFPLLDKFNHYSHYGFSPEGSFVWGFLPEGGIKIQYLFGPKAGQILVLLKGRQIFHFSYRADKKDWLVIDGRKEDWDLLMEGNNPPKGDSVSESYLKKPVRFFLRALDPLTLKQKEAKSFLTEISSMSCYDVNFSFNRLFYVQKDTGLWGIPLNGPGPSQLYFEPAEGFNVNSLEKECAFFGKSKKSYVNVLTLLDKEKILFRYLKERREFIRPIQDLFPLFLLNRNVLRRTRRLGLPSLNHTSYQVSFPSLPFKISYPFAGQENIFYDEEGERRYHDQLYHIPEAKVLTKAKENILAMDEEGRVVLKKNGEIFQAILQPFDPNHRKVVLHIPFVEICRTNQFFNREKTHVFVSTVWGDLYIMDVEGGKVRKFPDFFKSDQGSCFFAREISLSQGTIIGEIALKKHGANSLSKRKIVVYKFQRACATPPSEDSSSSIELLKQILKDEERINSFSFSRFRAILQEEGLFKNHPQALDEILWKVLLKFPSIYLDLLKGGATLKNLPPSSIYKTFPISLQKSLQQATLSLLDVTVSQSHPTRLSNWLFLRRLQPLLQQLPKGKQDFYINTIAVSISNGAKIAHPLLGEVFQSKIFYIVRENIQKLFGLKSRPVSDITLIRKSQSFSTLILSSAPIIGPVVNTTTDFGLHYALVDGAGHDDLMLYAMSPEGELITDHVVEWRIAGDSKRLYRGEIQVHTKKDFDGNILESSSTLNYPAFWRDQKLVGAVIVGSSLTSEAQILLKEYLSYFHEQGFQFSNSEIKDLKPFLLDLISCELDYFLTESHGSGDERNTLRFTKENYIIQGERWEGLSLKERIYLIIPKPSAEEMDIVGVEVNSLTDLLSYRDLSQAIAQRRSKKCGQIVYFHTGCWTGIKSRYILEAVNSPLFLNIPVITPSLGFANRSGNAIYALLHSLREERDFEGFRELLKSNEDYNQGRMDYYIFPDEDIYKKRVFSAISIPLDISVELFVKDSPFNAPWKKTEPDTVF